MVLLVSLNERLGETLFKDGSIDEHTADEVWIDIGGRSSVLDVALAVGMSSGCGDTERNNANGLTGFLVEEIDEPDVMNLTTKRLNN